jgi:hypothetical protein
MVAAFSRTARRRRQAWCRSSHVKTVRYLRFPTGQAGYFSARLEKSAGSGRRVRRKRKTRPVSRRSPGIREKDGYACVRQSWLMHCLGIEATGVLELGVVREHLATS